jgi:hypothetical protein
MIMTKTPMMTPIIPRFISPPSIRVITRNFQIRPLNELSLTSGPSCRKRVPYVGPTPLHLPTQPPKGRMHYTPREVKVPLEAAAQTTVIIALVNDRGA